MTAAAPGNGAAPRGRDPREEEEPRIVVHDKRRLDPQTGAVREPTAATGTNEPTPSPDAGTTPASGDDPRVRELTETLQRLKAEYDNYRRRADRERQELVERATGNVLATLLPVLDDIERARAHGDLTGAFGAVGESLVGVAVKLGLEMFAESGEAFDPQVHEAVMQAEPAAGAREPVIADVFRPGYRHAGRILRPAQVSVSEPTGSAATDADTTSADPTNAGGAGADANPTNAPKEDEPPA